jgi:hypothetical protein
MFNVRGPSNRNRISASSTLRRKQALIIERKQSNSIASASLIVQVPSSFSNSLVLVFSTNLLQALLVADMLPSVAKIEPSLQ